VHSILPTSTTITTREVTSAITMSANVIKEEEEEDSNAKLAEEEKERDLLSEAMKQVNLW